MPLFRKINCEKGWGGIWKITETFDELCDMLPHSACYREHAFHFAAERRRLEYVAVRLLIFTLTGEELQVEYLPSGRPFLRDRRLQLSISHTFGYAAVLFSEEYEAGLDIEVFSERIVKLKERLIGPEEAAETTYETPAHSMQVNPVRISLVISSSARAFAVSSLCWQNCTAALAQCRADYSLIA